MPRSETPSRSETRNIFEWIDVNDRLPENTGEVLVTDGRGSYAVAWLGGDLLWGAAVDMLDASNWDGGCTIELDETVTHWAEIPCQHTEYRDES